MLRVCLVFSFMRLGVPFIAPRQLGAVESNPGRQFLPSVDWCTGLSGAHWTVRYPHQTVGPATRHARIARPTVGSADRWLTGQSGAPPDSPVIYSRTPPFNSRERPFHQSQPGAPDTVRCTTRQSGAPKLSRVLAARAKSFPFVSFSDSCT
jgi:hypothetical protein